MGEGKNIEPFIKMGFDEEMMNCDYEIAKEKRMINCSVKKSICVLGLGVIGTTYAYALQDKGVDVEHLIRESKKATAPSTLDVRLLDGR